MLADLHQLESDLEIIARDGFAVDMLDLLGDAVGYLTPPENISTTECAAATRYIRTMTGGKRLWSLSLTPYVAGIQDALDDPNIQTVVVPGPGRSGKTIAAENHLHKRLRHGPMTDALWFLPSSSDVDSYADKDFATYFELHPDIASRVGKKPSDNKRTLKRIGGRFIQLLPANLNTVRGKQAPYIVGDEIDGYRKTLRDNFKQQTDFRGRAYGKARKVYLCSHADAGWTGGISAIWLESNRGIWWWHCPHCQMVSSPCPTAEWRMKLTWQDDRSLPHKERLQRVHDTAGMICPHCGTIITNDAKFDMLAGGRWIFDGQTIAPDGTISGAPTPNDTAGFWIHGTMSPFVSWGELAKEYVGALIFFETTGKAERLREVTAKSIGEPYEGPAGKRATVKMLQQRADPEAPTGYRMGEVPRGVRFLTASADTGGSHWDVAIIGWGENRESWLIDRFRIAAAADGRSLAPGLRLRDWNVLRGVMERSYPIKGRKGWHMPVASLGIDCQGVPGVTALSRQWASTMNNGPTAGANQYRLRLFKGASSKKAPEIGQPKEVNRDDSGKPLDPPVFEFLLGVHDLKKVVADSLGIDAPGPGYMHLPTDIDPRHIEEFLNETLVDDDWVRRGPNETFDLYVYAEAVRQMMKPDRPTIDWSRPPSWARPFEIRVKKAAAEVPPEKAREARRRRIIERMPH